MRGVRPGMLLEGLVTVQDICRVARVSSEACVGQIFGITHDPAFLISRARRRLRQLSALQTESRDSIRLPVPPDLIEAANITTDQAIGLTPIPGPVYCELLRERLDRFVNDATRRESITANATPEFVAEWRLSNQNLFAGIDARLGKERTIDYMDALWRDVWFWDFRDFRVLRYGLLMDTPVASLLKGFEPSDSEVGVFCSCFRALLARPLRRLELVKETARSLTSFIRSLLPLQVAFSQLMSILRDYFDVQHSDIPAARSAIHDGALTSGAAEVVRRLSRLRQKGGAGTVGDAIMSDRPTAKDILDLLAIDRMLDENVVDIIELVQSPLQHIVGMLWQCVGPSVADIGYSTFWHQKALWQVDESVVLGRMRFFSSGRIYAYKSLAERLVRLVSSLKWLSSDDVKGIGRRLAGDLTRELSLGFQESYFGAERLL